MPPISLQNVCYGVSRTTDLSLLYLFQKVVRILNDRKYLNVQD